MPHCARVLPQVFTPKATKSDTKLDGKLAAKYVFGGGMESEVTLATSGVLSGTFEAANVIAKGLVVNLECETPAPGKSGLLSSGLTTVNYKTGPFDTKASYDFYKGDLTGAPPPSHCCRPPEQRGRAASLLRRLTAAPPLALTAAPPLPPTAAPPLAAPPRAAPPATLPPPSTAQRGACAAACASGTFSGVTLGAECGYSTTKSALSKYTAACQYVQPDFTVSAKLAEVMKTPGTVFSGAYYPPTHNQGPYDTSLSVIRHKKPLKVRLSRRLNASAGRGSPHPSSCRCVLPQGLVGDAGGRGDQEGRHQERRRPRLRLLVQARQEHHSEGQGAHSTPPAHA